MIITIRLEGPLQSWGQNGKALYRETAAFPTKSGICGLMGCALGLERGNPRLTEICSSIDIMSRADRAGKVLVDLHTIVASKEWRLPQANGGNSTKTIMTRREYLQDASFLVAIEGPEELLTEIKTAFEHPVWMLSLGRRSCPPGTPIIAEISKEKTLLDAIKAAPLDERSDDEIFYEFEVPLGTGKGEYKRDIITGPRQFADRIVDRELLFRKEGESYVLNTN